MAPVNVGGMAARSDDTGVLVAQAALFFSVGIASERPAEGRDFLGVSDEFFKTVVKNRNADFRQIIKVLQKLF